MWEKVVRRLRTGSMPPPGMPRPDATAYRSSDRPSRRHARSRGGGAAEPRPPAVHRLNRSEYAQRHPRSAGARRRHRRRCCRRTTRPTASTTTPALLGVSPALLERYLSAAARISELAVASPAIVPGSETYRIRGDASQSEQNDALSPGTRGGLLATHTFPLDGEYLIRVRLLQTNLGSIRGLEYEHKLEVTLDGERVLLAPVGGPDDYVRSSVNATDVVNSLETRLQVRVKARAGQRAVGAAFLRRPPVYGGIASAAVPPHDADRHRSSRPSPRREHDGHRTVQRRARRRHAEPAAAFSRARAGAGATDGAGACAAKNRVARLRAARIDARSPTRISRDRWPSTSRGAKTAASSEASSWRSGRAGQPEVRVPRRARSRRALARRRSLSDQRRRARIASVVLPVEQHPGRRAAGRGGKRHGCASPPCWSAGAAHARRPARRRAGRELRRAVAARPQRAQLDAGQEPVSGLRRQSAAGLRARARAVRRQHHPRRIAAPSIC